MGLKEILDFYASETIIQNGSGGIHRSEPASLSLRETSKEKRQQCLIFEAYVACC